MQQFIRLFLEKILSKSRPTRIKENLDEWDYTLTAEEMSLIDALPMSGESGLDPDKIDF